MLFAACSVAVWLYQMLVALAEPAGRVSTTLDWDCQRHACSSIMFMLASWLQQGQQHARLWYPRGIPPTQH